MIPSINQWHATAQLPWGVVSSRRQGLPMGPGRCLGLQYPKRFTAVRDCRMDLSGSFLRFGWPIILTALAPIAPYVAVCVTTLGLRLIPLLRIWTMATHFPVWWSVVMTYDNGPIDVGGRFPSGTLHSNNANLGGFGVPGAGLQSRSTNTTAVLAPRLCMAMVAWIAAAGLTTYLKYNNGRFFANMEYWWGNIDTYFLGYGQTPRPGSTVSGAPPLYVEGSMAFAELGALCGPANLSGMFAWSGGPALNNSNPTKSYTTE